MHYAVAILTCEKWLHCKSFLTLFKIIAYRLYEPQSLVSSFQLHWSLCACAFLVAKWCPTPCDPMICSLPDCVHGIFQARILEWVAISSSRGSFQPRIKPTSPVAPALAGRFFTIEAPENILISTLNVNELNAPIKRYRLAEDILSQDWTKKK